MILSLVVMATVMSSTSMAKLAIFQNKGKQFHTGLLHKPKNLQGLGETHVMLADCGTLPEQFDLRDLNVVPPIKNQGNCGSCWAFSQTASLESAYAAAGGKILDLSEQELVSCDKKNYGCSGGLLRDFDYQIKNGQTAEANFPYKASDLKCKAGLPKETKGTSFTYVGQANRRPTEKEVMCALYQSHTIPWITVSATNRWGGMSSKSDSVYSTCGKGQTNHAIGLVGWKTVNGKVVFKIRNSWGTSWGSDGDRPGSEKGYAMMKLGCDNLGEEVAFITTSAMPCQPPKVKMPAEISIAKGDEVRLGVRPEGGVDYEWFVDATSQGKGDFIYVSPSQDTIYKIVAKNSCGQAESSVRVKLQGNP